MSIYTSRTMGEIVKDNAYAGRGIVIGKTKDGSKAAIAYFIMGRSENSRNRVFVEEGNDVIIYPFDESKVEDPSLIIYAPIRVHENKVIFTNGDQTDTIYNFIKDGKCFRGALKTREFEPDAPNLTPRISGMLTLEEGNFSYEMSILKSMDAEGSECARYTWDYPSVNGLGHFIHTYEHDGNPLPTFQGEPRRVEIPDTAEELLSDIWANLNEENKISIYVRYIDLETKEFTNKLINKNK
ncbi:MAG: IMP cyclohydrolase [Firmicutes bacterium]|nr:IMP cyclohydrolase [Bacillota bacterium]